MAWPSPTIMCVLSVTGELCLIVVDQHLDVTDCPEPHSFVFRGGHNYCSGNQSNGCCFAPTIR